jgi:xanthine dehydrogenase molybdopterin-binding subunit B
LWHLTFTGEAQYINDMKELPGELHGVLVLSTEANATIKSIDASNALVSLSFPKVGCLLPKLFTALYCPRPNGKEIILNCKH